MIMRTTIIIKCILNEFFSSSSLARLFLVLLAKCQDFECVRNVRTTIKIFPNTEMSDLFCAFRSKL